MELSDKILFGKYSAYYGKLLTDKQREILEMYLDLDMSLFEIAERLNVSRQAVRDVLMRSVSIMRNFEEKLGLLRKNEEIQKKILAIMNIDDKEIIKKSLSELYEITEVD